MEFLPGPMELVLILIIVAMLFGVGRLPEVFGAVGKGIREFRREVSSAQEAISPSVEKDKIEAPAVDEAPEKQEQ
ncbi:MAG: twin-arginine translocase TatA/TatE family subunit [Caldilineaceae bacterium]